MLIFIRRFAFITIITLLALILVALGLYLYASTRTNGSIASNGETRHYLVHVPARYNAGVPAPLIISLHGAYLYPGFQMRLTQWNELADNEGFLVVYPKAAGFPPLWRMEPGNGLEEETQFFVDLIDKVSADYNVDRDRIYINGFSNGAAMSVMLSCTLSERVAAFGLVATPVPPQEWCANPRPAPVIAVHGVDDPLALYAGGENFLTTEPLPAIRDWTAAWAQRNQCNPDARDSAYAPQVEISEYAGCSDGSSVVLYSLSGAGHVWPGGMPFPGDFSGANSDAVNASDVMWQFFRNHPLSLRRF